ncbi:putative F-box protein At1g30930 [Silene latifolia]|uniref:putative F-box protein At1g30930 n=1 Tax=Silene latifolia TaxID=37657 RepID=UPI003D77CD2B
MEMNVNQNIKGGVIRWKCNTSDASSADIIPEDIEIDILSRLSSKSLSRCQCVSKHWNDTLTIKAFLLKNSLPYDNKHPQLVFAVRSGIWEKGSILSYKLDDADKTTTLPVSRIRGRNVNFTDFIPMSNYSYISNICNDLICLFDPFSTCVDLLNIKTQDFIRLPAITIKSVDPFRFWYALGFDPVEQVFKVLISIYPCSKKKCTPAKAAILTVGSKYWNPIDCKSLHWRSINNSICLNGVIYWVHKNKIDNFIELTVVAFDLNHEAFITDNELVVTPMRTTYTRHYLTSLKECPTLFIWKMKSDDHTEEVEQWTLFNHKTPNAAWKMRNFTNMMVPSDAHGDTVAGGSTLLQYSHPIDYSDYSVYFFYDLEKLFVIE